MLGLPPGSRAPGLLVAEAVNHGLFNKVVSAPEPISYRTFSAWSEVLSDDILRGKGLVTFADKPGVWLWQKVGSQTRLEDCSGHLSVTGYELLLISKSRKSLPLFVG